MGTFPTRSIQSLSANLPYDPHKDFAAGPDRGSFNMVVVNPSPRSNDCGFDRGGESQSRQLSYGTFGVGTSAISRASCSRDIAKINLTAVPYKGAAPAITDLIGARSR